MQGKARDADVENGLVDMERRETGSRMNWETGIDIHTLLCIKQVTNENLLYGTVNSTHCSNLTRLVVT